MKNMKKAYYCHFCKKWYKRKELDCKFEEIRDTFETKFEFEGNQRYPDERKKLVCKCKICGEILFIGE